MGLIYNITFVFIAKHFGYKIVYNIVNYSIGSPNQDPIPSLLLNTRILVINFIQI